MRPDDKRRNNKGNPNMVKGKSLNPNGRPKGSVNKYTALSRELMSTKGPEIVEKVIEMALEGDRTCLKMCMDRILPTTKAVELRSSEGNGQVVINIGGLEAKVIEAEEVAPLEYAEGVIIEDTQLDEKVVNIGG
jgi:predicted ThiF/HesA family dinucleotide-utilizing enzyme